MNNEAKASKTIQFGSLMLPALALAVALLAAQPALAQYYGAYNQSAYRAFTWPPISISVTTQNGWVVAQGRSEDNQQRIMWTTRVAPANGPISVRHGYTSAYVESGGRQFVLDYASGQFKELNAGMAVSQDALRSSAYQTPPQQPSVGGGSAYGAKQTAAGNGDKAMDELTKANQRLMDTLNYLESITRLHEAGRATPEDVKNAQKSVDVARAAVRQVQGTALKAIAPELLAEKREVSVTTRPAAMLPKVVPQAREVTEASSRMLQLTADLARAQVELGRLSNPGQDQPRDLDAITRAQSRVNVLASDLQRADRNLQHLRVTEATKSVTKNADEQLKKKIADVEKRILTLTDEHAAAQQAWTQIQDAMRTGEAVSTEETNNAQQRLMNSVKSLSAAKRTLDALYKQASTPANVDTVTGPM